MGELNGRVALVTGGASGIGRATAEALATSGAAVLVADLDVAGGRAAAEAIAGHGGRARAQLLDVRDPDSCAAAVATAQESFGRLDILVNSAGIARMEPFLEATLAVWDEVIGINLTGTFLIGQAVARAMVANSYGRIINIASVSGLRGGNRRAAYGASKGGVIMLTRVMANELAAHGITVNAIAPGPIETPLVASAHISGERDEWLARIPVGRYGVPAEIAATACFLASESTGFLTGQVITVDGGFTASGLLARGEG